MYYVAFSAPLVYVYYVLRPAGLYVLIVASDGRHNMIVARHIVCVAVFETKYLGNLGFQLLAEHAPLLSCSPLRQPPRTCNGQWGSAYK